MFIKYKGWAEKAARHERTNYYIPILAGFVYDLLQSGKMIKCILSGFAFFIFLFLFL